MLILQVQQTHARHQKRISSVRAIRWKAPERRLQLGQYSRLMEELRCEDANSFRNFVRVDPEMFVELVESATHRIWKEDTAYRKAIEPGMKVAITLRHFATGESYHSLMYGFRVPHNIISKFVPEVCEAIIAEYAPEVITCPSTPEEWRPIAQHFSRRWNLPHCIGALDGKHIAMTCPQMVDRSSTTTRGSTRSF